VNPELEHPQDIVDLEHAANEKQAAAGSPRERQAAILPEGAGAAAPCAPQPAAGQQEPSCKDTAMRNSFTPGRDGAAGGGAGRAGGATVSPPLPLCQAAADGPSPPGFAGGPPSDGGTAGAQAVQAGGSDSGDVEELSAFAHFQPPVGWWRRIRWAICLPWCAPSPALSPKASPKAMLSSE